jgi:hypothetical protein
MPATLSTIDALLKEVYQDGITEQINQDVTTLKRISRSSEGVSNEVGGRYVTFPIHVTRNSGIGARGEMDALPPAGNQGHNAARVPLKYQYGSIQLTGQTIKLADSNYQAFANVLDNEVSGLGKDLAKYLNYQVYGAPGGARAVATAVGTTVSYVTSTSGFKNINIGGRYSIYSAANYASGTNTPITNGNGVYVTAVDASNGRITFSTAASGGSAVSLTTAVGDVIVTFGSLGKEWNGFTNIVSTSGTLHNIDPSVQALWKAVVKNGATPGTAEALTEARMIATVDDVRVNGGKTSVGFCNLGVRRAYFNLLKDDRQYVNTQEFAGGFNGLAFTTDQGEIPIVVDVDAPANKMYFIDESQMCLYREADWSWMDMDGNKFQRVVANDSGTAGNYDAYYATMYQYSELATHKRNAQAVLNDITEA